MKKIFCVGDCYTSGLDFIDNKTNYTEFLSKRVKGKYEIMNGGRTMLRMQNIAEHFDLFLPKEMLKGDVFCIWIGSNDLYMGYKPETVFKNLSLYYNHLIEEGLNIIVLTLFPRFHSPYISSIVFDKNRKIYNSLIVNNFENVVNVAKSSRLGIKTIKRECCHVNLDGSPEDTEIFEGHINAVGHKIVADMVYKKMYKIGLL